MDLDIFMGIFNIVAFVFLARVFYKMYVRLETERIEHRAIIKEMFNLKSLMEKVMKDKKMEEVL